MFELEKVGSFGGRGACRRIWEMALIQHVYASEPDMFQFQPVFFCLVCCSIIVGENCYFCCHGPSEEGIQFF
jgi:hypothetical protein